MVGIIVNDKLSVSPQIGIDDLVEIKNLGFETIICNRPDGESFDQTPYGEIEKVAHSLGLKIIHQPIIGSSLNLNSAIEFASSLENSGKVFAYCRTGTRCITLWALAQREANNDPQEIYENCAKLGYDVSGALNNIW